MSINDLKANKSTSDIKIGNEKGVNIEYLNLIVTISQEINNKINSVIHNKINSWLCNNPKKYKTIGNVDPMTNESSIKKIIKKIEIL